MLNDEAVALMTRGSFAEAERLMARGIALTPTLPSLHFNLGVLRAKQASNHAQHPRHQQESGRQHRAAIAAFEAALALDPLFVEARFNLGRTWQIFADSPELYGGGDAAREIQHRHEDGGEGERGGVGTGGEECGPSRSHALAEAVRHLSRVVGWNGTHATFTATELGVGAATAAAAAAATAAAAAAAAAADRQGGRGSVGGVGGGRGGRGAPSIHESTERGWLLLLPDALGSLESAFHQVHRDDLAKAAHLEHFRFSPASAGIRICRPLDTDEDRDEDGDEDGDEDYRDEEEDGADGEDGKGDKGDKDSTDVGGSDPSSGLRGGHSGATEGACPNLLRWLLETSAVVSPPRHERDAAMDPSLLPPLPPPPHKEICTIVNAETPLLDNDGHLHFAAHGNIVVPGVITRTLASYLGTHYRDRRIQQQQQQQQQQQMRKKSHTVAS